jgi:hypothetical protein
VGECQERDGRGQERDRRGMGEGQNRERRMGGERDRKTGERWERNGRGKG